MSKQNKRRGGRNANQKTRSAKRDERNITSEQCKDNDPSWYAANEQILKDSATLAFSTLQGSKLSIPNMPTRMPGIMRINMVGVPGVSDGSTSAVNIASRNIYSYVRHANSGASNYEAPDLMLYLLAMDQAYMYYSWMRRIYCTFRTYFQRNYYTPKWIIESMDVDYADLEAKLSDFRLYINIFAQKCGSLVTPSGMTFLTRHSWLNSNIFADSPTDKAQFIYFNTPCYGIYSARTSTKGGELIYQDVKPESGKITLARIIEFGNKILEPLIADEDINIMSGDILKAFGDNVNKLSLVGEDDVILPVYSPEVLTQIQNLTEHNLIASDIKVQQSNGYIVTDYGTYNSSMDITLLKLDEDGVLNMPMDNPTPGDVMVATRLTGVVEPAGNKSYKIKSCGTEIVFRADIYTLNDAGNGLNRSGTAYLALSNTNGTGDTTDTTLWINLRNAVNGIADLATFNAHPKALVAVYNQARDTLLFSRIVMEFDNYTVINPSDVKQMDDVAVLNEFDVPQMGVYK